MVRQDSRPATRSPKTMESFEMFWPIVAGKREGDVLYSLKLLKEKVREFFIFAPFKKAEYNIILGEKRMVEAESLIGDGKLDEAEKTIEALHSKREKALAYIQEAEADGIRVVEIKGRLKSSLEKQALLAEYIKSKHPDSKDLLEKDLEHNSSLQEKIN